MKKPVILLAIILMALLLITSSCASQPSEPPPPDPSLSGSPGSSKASTHVIRRAENEADYPNHGITTTKVEPKPGESVSMVSGSWVRFTMDDLVEKSDTVLIGKVVDIFPSRQVDKPPWIVITDVVIKVERYLYGQPQSAYIAVIVPGGRVGEMAMLVTDQPEFNLGEEVALFLLRPQLEIAPPEGFAAADYYMVSGLMQGKLGYIDGNMITLEGNSVTFSEIEQKIASIHGDE